MKRIKSTENLKSNSILRSIKYHVNKSNTAEDHVTLVSTILTPNSTKILDTCASLIYDQMIIDQTKLINPNTEFFVFTDFYQILKKNPMLN